MNPRSTEGWKVGKLTATFMLEHHHLIRLTATGQSADPIAAMYTWLSVDKQNSCKHQRCIKLLNVNRAFGMGEDISSDIWPLGIWQLPLPSCSYARTRIHLDVIQSGNSILQFEDGKRIFFGLPKKTRNWLQSSLSSETWPTYSKSYRPLSERIWMSLLSHEDRTICICITITKLKSKGGRV